MSQLRPAPVISLGQIYIDPCRWLRPRKGVCLTLPLLGSIQPLLTHSCPVPTLFNPFPTFYPSLRCIYLLWRASQRPLFLMGRFCPPQCTRVLHCHKVLFSAFVTVYASNTHVLQGQPLNRVGPLNCNSEQIYSRTVFVEMFHSVFLITDQSGMLNNIFPSQTP